MGDEEPSPVPDGEGWSRSTRRRRAGEASDAEVRAAVESVVEGSPGQVPRGRPPSVDGTIPADAVIGGDDGSVANGAGPPGPAATGRPRSPDVAPGAEPDRPDHDAGIGSEPGVRGADIRETTPTDAAVGAGIGLLTVGVLLVAYRTLLATGAGRFVATLYGVGGLLIVGGFVAHALERADEIDG